MCCDMFECKACVNHLSACIAIVHGGGVPTICLYGGKRLHYEFPVPVSNWVVKKDKLCEIEINSYKSVKGKVEDTIKIVEEKKRKIDGRLRMLRSWREELEK